MWIRYQQGTKSQLPPRIQVATILYSFCLFILWREVVQKHSLNQSQPPWNTAHEYKAAHQTMALTDKQESMWRWRYAIYQNRLGLRGIQHATKFASVLCIVAICGSSSFHGTSMYFILFHAWKPSTLGSTQAIELCKKHPRSMILFLFAWHVKRPWRICRVVYMVLWESEDAFLCQGGLFCPTAAPTVGLLNGCFAGGQCVCVIILYCSRSRHRQQLVEQCWATTF